MRPYRQQRSSRHPSSIMMNTATPDTAVFAHSPERAVRATNHVGMILALVSFTMMFCALFYAYGLLRIRSVAWPPPGVPAVPLLVPSLITVMMVASSLSVERACKALALGQVQSFQRFGILTVVLGSLFLALQAGVWVDLWYGGLTLGAGPYGSLFYFLTAFHALHVLAGLGILVWMVFAAPKADHPEIRASRAHMSAMFWHFVGVVWLIIFSLVYVF